METAYTFPALYEAHMNCVRAAALIACFPTAIVGSTAFARDNQLAAATAEWIAIELREHPFGTSRAEWRRRVPSAAWRDYRGSFEYPPDSVLPQPEGLW